MAATIVDLVYFSTNEKIKPRHVNNAQKITPVIFNGTYSRDITLSSEYSVVLEFERYSAHLLFPKIQV